LFFLNAINGEAAGSQHTNNHRSQSGAKHFSNVKKCFIKDSIHNTTNDDEEDEKEKGRHTKKVEVLEPGFIQIPLAENLE
jgi:hypothetical protein